MSHIIGSKCVDVKDGACIKVCPVEAIWDSEKQAIQMGDGEYVKKNYENFGLSYE